MLKSQIWEIGEKTGLDLGYAKFKIIVRELASKEELRKRG